MIDCCMMLSFIVSIMIDCMSGRCCILLSVLYVIVVVCLYIVVVVEFRIVVCCRHPATLSEVCRSIVEDRSPPLHPASDRREPCD